MGKQRVQRDGLGRCAGEAVQDEALGGIRFLQALVHQVDDQGVGHKLAGVHVGLGLLAEFGLVLDRRAEDVPRGDVRRAELFDELRGLRALAGTRRAQQYDIHARTSFLSLRCVHCIKRAGRMFASARRWLRRTDCLAAPTPRSTDRYPKAL